MPAIIVDPALQAAVIRQFNLRGELAPFNLTENVVPVFDIGSLTGNLPTVVTTLAGTTGVRVGLSNVDSSFQTTLPKLAAAELDNDSTVNPTAGDVGATTGQLAVATFLMDGFVCNNGAITDISFEWRNAADSATLATWTLFVGTGGPTARWGPYVIDNTVLNQRMRVVYNSTITATVNSTITFNRINYALADV